MSETPDAVLLYFRPCPGGTLLHALRAQAWSERRLRDEVGGACAQTRASIVTLAGKPCHFCSLITAPLRRLRDEVRW